jgi:hypothetical protein
MPTRLKSTTTTSTTITGPRRFKSRSNSKREMEPIFLYFVDCGARDVEVLLPMIENQKPSQVEGKTKKKITGWRLAGHEISQMDYDWR